MRNKITYFLITFRLVFLFLTVLGILFDLFFLRTNSDLLIISVVFFWLTVNLYFNLDGSFSILMSLILLVSGLFVSLFEKMPVIYGSRLEKISVWIYIFLTIGTIKKILEMVKQPARLRKLPDLIGNLKQLSVKEIFILLKAFFNCETKKISLFYYKEMWFIPYIFKKIREIRILDLVTKLSEIRLSVVKIPRVKFKAINYHFAKIKKSKSFIFIIKVPLVHLVLSVLIINRLVKEILFYHDFFRNSFLYQINHRVTPKILSFWSSVIFFILMFLFLRKSIYRKVDYLNKRKKTFEWFVVVSLMTVVFFGNKKIFLLERDKFEFRPYIQRLSVDISSRYSEVIIYGRNFREMPFKGKVFINDKVQRVNNWGDREITIEIDPIQSETGELKMVNDYGFGNGIESNKIGFTYFDSRKSSKTDEDRFWQSLKDLVLKRLISLFGKPKKILDNTRQVEF